MEGNEEDPKEEDEAEAAEAEVEAEATPPKKPAKEAVVSAEKRKTFGRIDSFKD